jgi:hypothetical protein
MYIDTSTLALLGGLRLSTMPLLFEKESKRGAGARRKKATL